MPVLATGRANTYCAATDRGKLERLCRYMTRPALANERIKVTPNGDVILKLKSPYRDGTTYEFTAFT